MAEEILAKRKVVLRSIQEGGVVRYESVSVKLSTTEISLGLRCYGARHYHKSADIGFNVSVFVQSDTLEVRPWDQRDQAQLGDTPGLLLGVLGEVLKSLEERVLAAEKLGQAMWDVWAAGFEPAGTSEAIREAKEAVKEALEKRILLAASGWDARFEDQGQIVERLRKQVQELLAAPAGSPSVEGAALAENARIGRARKREYGP